jgi:GNAT superfamily N-acetyltransferase
MPEHGAKPATSCRFAEPADAPNLARLISEQDQFYHRKDPFFGRDGAAIVRGWLRGEGCDGRFAVLFLDSAMVGFAHCAIFRPGIDLSGALFVKDLFVSDTARSTGAGTALMRWLACWCRRQGIGRIDLETDTINPRARSFYARLGGEELPGKVAIRFDARALLDLATRKA